MTLNVLIVEDNAEFLACFSNAVLADPSLSLVGAVSTVAAARALIDATSPDVILADLGLPDGSGIEVIRQATAKLPECDVLVITMFGDDGHIIDSIAAGATGYLLKDAAPDRIVAAIHEVHAGGSPISPSIARRVLQRFKITDADPVPPSAATPPTEGQRQESPLSERETEILRLVAKGLNFDNIGGILEISPHTVVTHVKRIYRKLAVHSRGEAVYEARLLAYSNAKGIQSWRGCSLLGSGSDEAAG
jgi:DNA-binding NarL/FixJ family response regulator